MLKELEPGVSHVVILLPHMILGSDAEPWMLCKVTGTPAYATEGDIAEARELGFAVKNKQRVLQLKKFEPYEPGGRRHIFCKDIVITAPVSALCGHNLKKPPREQTADLRAIIAALNPSDMKTLEVERLMLTSRPSCAVLSCSTGF
eukprot:2496933-Pleurochrysis_carterae.AAC.1